MEMELTVISSPCDDASETYISGEFETVGDLRRTISSNFDVAVGGFLLLSLPNHDPRDVFLLNEDDHSLSGYGIVDGSAVELRKKLVPPRTLEVSFIFERWRAKGRFASDEEVFKLQKWIEREFSVPPRRQVLEIFHVTMQGRARLEDYVADDDRPVAIGVREIEPDPTRMVSIVVEISRRGGRGERRETYVMDNRDTLRTLILNVRVMDPVNDWRRHRFSMRGKDWPENEEEPDQSFEELGIVDGTELRLLLM